MLAIRLYHSTDLDAVIEVFLQSIRQVASTDYDQSQIDAWAQADRTIWQNRRLSRPTWVAVLDKSVVGFTDLEPDGHIDMMFVHPAYQRLGIASLLLERVESTAASQQLFKLFTEASLTARSFFERRGFRVLAQQQVSTRGQLLTNFRMEKMIGKD